MVLDGWRGARVRTVGVSFGVSLGLHALLFALVVVSLSRAAKDAPLVVSRVKLVWVDPAPAAAPSAGVPEGTTKAAAAVSPPVPVAPPAPIARPVPATKSRAEKKSARAKPAPPPAARPAPEAAIAPPAAEIPAGDERGLPEASGETPGAGADGVAGRRAGGTGVMRVGDVATAPVLVTRVVPEYPRRARLAGIEGEVLLEIVVDRYGRVAIDPKVVRAVPELERAAVAAVRQWRFRPARDRAGTAVAVLMEVPVRFVLHEATADASR